MPSRHEENRLTETRVNAWIDGHRMHDSARSPGVYAIELASRSSRYTGVELNWYRHYDCKPPDGFIQRLADAKTFLYVGSHGKSVYRRLCQHARGDKSSTIMSAWEPQRVAGIWPGPAESGEYNKASQLADEKTAVWVDGEYL